MYNKNYSGLYFSISENELDTSSDKTGSEAQKELLMEKWCPEQHGRRQNISSNEIQERRLIPEMHLFFLLANGNVL